MRKLGSYNTIIVMQTIMIKHDVKTMYRPKANTNLISDKNNQFTHWTKRRISLCVTTYILALSCIFPAEDRAKFPTKCYEYIS